MESTSIYHLPVENYFRSKAIDTIVMNPKLVKQFKDTLNKWGDISGLHKKFTREASRVNYKKAIFFFISISFFL